MLNIDTINGSSQNSNISAIDGSSSNNNTSAIDGSANNNNTSAVDGSASDGNKNNSPSFTEVLTSSLKDHVALLQSKNPINTEEAKNLIETLSKHEIITFSGDFSNDVKEKLVDNLQNDANFREKFAEGLDEGRKYIFQTNGSEDGQVDTEKNNPSNIEVQQVFGNTELFCFGSESYENLDASLFENYDGTSLTLSREQALSVIEDHNLSGQEKVNILEELGVFAFSGEQADMLRDYVSQMFDKSDTMTKIIALPYKEGKKEKFLFQSADVNDIAYGVAYGLNSNVEIMRIDTDSLKAAQSNENSNEHAIAITAHEMMHGFLDEGHNVVLDTAMGQFVDEFGSLDYGEEFADSGENFDFSAFLKARENFHSKSEAEQEAYPQEKFKEDSQNPISPFNPASIPF